MKNDNESIVFGGGCFWCTEAVFKMLKGIIKTMPGYAGGHTKNPTYDDVCNGDTGHAEVLEVEYNPKIIPLEKLLDVFFEMHDPTSLNRQGADSGSQYRSIVLYNTEEQKKEVTNYIKNAQKNFNKPIVTEVVKLDKFYPAETYHKDYYSKNPIQPYCLMVVRPKVEKIKKEFKSELA
jgi:peptide-methionine (S)-S-oxide reductase